MILQPYRPDIEIPDCSITDLLFVAADRHGDSVAFIDGVDGRSITFDEWLAGTLRVAAGFAARGLARGDVVALFSPNHPEYPVAFHGVVRAGGVVTTANPLYTAEEFGKQLRDCKARFVITIGPFLEKVTEAIAGLDVQEVFTFDGADGSTDFAELVASDDAVPDVTIDPRRDLCVLPYSSGTTGMPKGVMLTHRNLVANAAQLRGVQSKLLEPGDAMMGVLPFFHIYGMVAVMNDGLNAGATVVTLSRFELATFLQAIQDHRVSYANLVPPIILALAKHPAVDDYDLSSLRTLLSGAAPLGAELASACRQRLGCNVMQGYGLTETSPVTHFPTVEMSVEDPGTVGPALANTEVKLVDENREPAPEGGPGEVCIRGPQVMLGYLNQPEATAAMLDDEGWLYTGDIGRSGPDGRLYIVDRVKELIKYKGAQVAPAELEALLVGHPAIRDAAVVGVPDDEAGELPKAFVVLAEPIELDAIVAWVAEQVSPTKKIRLIEEIDAIPRSASGKILRRELAGK